MATAKRVAQDAQWEGVVRSVSDKLVAVHEETGKPTTYQTLAETHDVIADQRLVPQPDRILLNLSLAEAETLAIVGYSTGGHPNGRRGHIDGIKRALVSAGVRFNGGLNAHPDIWESLRFKESVTANVPGVSLNQGTAASSLGGGCSPAVQPAQAACDVLKQAQMDPTRGAYDHKKAQLAALKQAIDHDMVRVQPHRW